MHKKKVVIVMVIPIVLVIVAMAIWYGIEQFLQNSDRTKKELREALTNRFNLEPSEHAQVILNIPPKPNILPGQVFLDRSFLIAKQQEKLGEQDVTPGPLSDLSLSFDLSRNLSGHWLSSMIGTAGDLAKKQNVRMNIADFQVITATVEALKRKALNSYKESAKEDVFKPRIIYAVFKGIVSLTIQDVKASASSAGSSNKDAIVDAGLRNSMLEVNVKQRNKNRSDIILSTKEPIVLAFLAYEAQFVTTHLGAGQPNEVKFIPLSVFDDEQEEEARVNSTSAQWQAVAIAQGVYPGIPSLNQPGNLDSARLFLSTTRSMGAVSNTLIASRLDMPLTEERLFSELETVIQSGRESKASSLAIYYIGHAIYAIGDDVRLIMGDISQAALNTTEKNQERSNGIGWVRLYRLVEVLQSSNSDFSLILDSCFPHEKIEDYREIVPSQYSKMRSLNSKADFMRQMAANIDLTAEQIESQMAMTENMADYYAGIRAKRGSPFSPPRYPGRAIASDLKGKAIQKRQEAKRARGYASQNRQEANKAHHDSMTAMGEWKSAIQAFNSELKVVLSRNSYMTGSNPLVFSSPPGLLALEVSNPTNAWGLSVGPNADRLYRQYQATCIQSECQDEKVKAIEYDGYLHLVKSITDIYPTNFIHKNPLNLPANAISWSSHFLREEQP